MPKCSIWLFFYSANYILGPLNGWFEFAPRSQFLSTARASQPSQGYENVTWGTSFLTLPVPAPDYLNCLCRQSLANTLTAQLDSSLISIDFSIIIARSTVVHFERYSLTLLPWHLHSGQDVRFYQTFYSMNNKVRCRLLKSPYGSWCIASLRVRPRWGT